MKKFFALVLIALVALTSLSAVAFADATDPMTNDKINVFYLEDFNGLEGEPSLPWTSGGDITAEYKDDKLVINENLLIGGGWVYAKYDNYRYAPASNANVGGMGFYIENNTERQIGVQGYWIGCDNFVCLGSYTYYTLIDGVVTEYQSSGDGSVALEAGFKGTLLFPWYSFGSGMWYGSDSMEVTYDTLNDWVALGLSDWMAEEGNVVIDNFLIYGSTEMEGETVDIAAGETPTEEPTEEPTAEPSEEPTEEPATDAPTVAPDDNADGGFPIWIVIAVVAVVIVAVIIVVATKKKK